jgi:hypothetical protein
MHPNPEAGLDVAGKVKDMLRDRTTALGPLLRKAPQSDTYDLCYVMDGGKPRREFAATPECVALLGAAAEIRELLAAEYDAVSRLLFESGNCGLGLTRLADALDAV